MPSSRRLFLVAALAAVSVAACSKGGGASSANTLSVAATAVPHAEILEFVKPKLATQGLELKIKVFNDYVQPNLVVDQGRMDVSYFETKPYLDEFNRTRGTHLVTVAGIHVEPFGAYSRKWKSLDQLPQGAVVALPNEPSNTGRALLLLQKAGLVTLRDPNNPLATVKDVVANPKGLQFKELEAPALPRVLDQVDLALINTNYALDAKLNPTRDALALESSDSPYVNFLVSREDNRNDPRVLKLAAALRSPEVKGFILKKYEGAVLPAF
jgi:D-methionine transport system substrate-binding protein